MSRRVVVVVLGLVVAAGAGAYLLLNLSLESPSPALTTAAPPPAAIASPLSKPQTAEPARVSATPSTKKIAAARPEPATPQPVAAPEAAAPTTGTLQIDSDVAGAQVFLDRTFVGNTPTTAKDVAPGQHRLNVSAPGVDGYAETIDVVAGPRDIMVRLKDIRLDAKIDVVHKHAFGSCKGTLSATPQGIRYETSNAGDAFTAVFADIAAFDVDYNEKNLKVKLRNGRQYNFTDAAGNADRLYLFHGEVNAVREKLRKGGD